MPTLQFPHNALRQRLEESENGSGDDASMS